MTNSEDAAAIPPSFANFPRSNSQFLVSTTSIGNGDQQSNAGGEINVNESLQNLSLAIIQRQQSENGMESMASSNGSLPSLVDKISDVQSLVDKLVTKQQTP